MQELPGNHSPAQDSLAVQEGEQTGRPDDGAERRQDRRGLRRSSRRAGCGWQRGARGEYDKQVGQGTMSRSGATCPSCGVPSMTMEDIRLQGRAGRLGSVMTAVVVDGASGKDYRPPVQDDSRAVDQAQPELDRVYRDIPFGLPDEPIAGKDALGIRVPLYGLDRWRKLFTPRQLFSMGTFVKHTRAAREVIETLGHPPEWTEAIIAYLALALDRLADRCSSLCQPDPSPTQSGVMHTFSKFAFP